MRLKIYIESNSIGNKPIDIYNIHQIVTRIDDSLYGKTAKYSYSAIQKDEYGYYFVLSSYDGLYIEKVYETLRKNGGFESMGIRVVSQFLETEHQYLLKSDSLNIFKNTKTGTLLRTNSKNSKKKMCVLFSTENREKNILTEKEFVDRIKQGIQNKLNEFSSNLIKHMDGLDISILESRVSTVYYKNRHKHYTSNLIFSIRGNKELKKFILETGIGSLNGSGFGFLECVE